MKALPEKKIETVFYMSHCSEVNQKSKKGKVVGKLSFL